MDFSLSTDQEALRDGVRSFCEARLSVAELRELEQRGVDRTLWGEYAEMGLIGLRASEEAGGVGLGMAEAVLVFEELGRCVAPGPNLWSHLAAALVPGVAAGDTIVTGLDLRGASDAPRMVEWLELCDAIVTIHDDGVRLLSTSGVQGERIESPLDPFTPVSRVDPLPEGELVGDADLAGQLVSEGMTLVSALMLGIAEASQALATAYAADREQFDRPVGSFQAVKHILADCFVRQELARAATYAAGVLLDGPHDEEVARTVTAASLIAEEAAMKNARACIQVHGGMGFTWENASHYYLKRVWVLENAFGHGATRAEELAKRIADAA